MQVERSVNLDRQNLQIRGWNLETFSGFCAREDQRNNFAE